MALLATEDVQSGEAAPPAARPWGTQRWSQLLFMHWPVPVSAIEAMLPGDLAVDTSHGSAWVGIVCFRLGAIQPRGWPLVCFPSFLEVNVRTYVVGPAGPGVWFASMDAASTTAVLATRWKWNFNYQRAHIRSHASHGDFTLHSQRCWPDRGQAVLNVQARIGGPCEAAELDNFLIERYAYYCVDKRGDLMCGKVAHAPYALQCAEVLALDQSLLGAAGVRVDGLPEHARYCAGVRSTVYPPGKVRSWK